MMSLPKLHLEALDRSNWRRALEVRTAPGQLKFVADHEPVALVILAKCYLRPGDLEWEPFGIYADDSMVGIVALAWSGEACEIYHLVIDRAHQGRGLGKAAMQMIVEWVRRERPACRSLRLTLHPENERARRLYTSVGFVPSGEDRQGEPLWQRTFAAAET